MATHNQVRVIGYLLKDPQIINEGEDGGEKVIFLIRTTHSDIEGYPCMKFQDIMVYYDGRHLMPKLKSLKCLDLVDIKGVFNILSLTKTSRCPGCGAVNIKENGTATFIYPIALHKLNGLQVDFERDEEIPERILQEHYEEVSNQALIIGTVVSDPEALKISGVPCCRYRLGVDRKYYIKTQSDLTADYPWVYSFLQQAERDFRHLKKGSVILVDAFIQNRRVEGYMTCAQCGAQYRFPDAATEFIPFSVEYLSDFITDEELALGEALEKQQELQAAYASVFES